MSMRITEWPESNAVYTRSGVSKNSSCRPSCESWLRHACSRRFAQVVVCPLVQIQVGKQLFWAACLSTDSGQRKTVVKVSKSRHNSTIKSLIQNSPILFQDNIALSLHCTFQSLMFSDHGENANSISRNDTLTHTHTTTTVCLRGSAHRGIIIIIHIHVSITVQSLSCHTCAKNYPEFG